MNRFRIRKNLKRGVPSFALHETSFKTSDYEQSRIRIALPLCVFLWSLVHPLSAPNPHSSWGFGHLELHTFVAVIYLTFGVVIWVGWQIVYRLFSKWAFALRALCLFGDISAISIYTAVSEDASIVLLPVYLSAIIGYGMRFGRPYLLTALSLSLFEFSLAIFFNPVLAADTSLVVTYFVAMIFLPMYTLDLLQKYANVLDAYMEASADRELFIKMLGHEFRAPLQSIVSLTESCEALLRKEQACGAFQGEFQSALRDIQHCGDRMLAVANRIALSNGRPRTHTENDQSRTMILRDVYVTIRVCAIHASRKFLNLQWSIDEGVPSCMILDSAALQEILINLIDNAIKNTVSGSVSLRVRFSASDNTAGILELIVADTGSGIFSDDTSRGSDELSDNSPITRRSAGLGVAIIQRQITRLSGALEYSANNPCGTKAIVKLPVKSVGRENAGDTRWLRVCIISQRNLSAVEVELMTKTRLFPHLIDITSAFPTEPSATTYDLCVFLADQAGIYKKIEAHSIWPSVKELPRILLGECAEADCAKPALSANIYVNLNDPEGAVAWIRTIRTMVERNGRVEKSIQSPHPYSLRSVLLIDDSPLTIESIAKILTGHGCQCTASLSIEHAMDEIASRSFDVIVADRYVGEVDFLDLLNSDGSGSWDCRRLILLTGDSDTGRELVSRGIPVGKLLIKPVSRKTLVESIRGVHERVNNVVGAASRNDRSFPINWSALEDLFGSEKDPGSLSRLISRFEDEMLIDVVDSCSRFRNSDFVGCAKVLHRMVGLAGLFGAVALAAELVEMRKSVISVVSIPAILAQFGCIDASILAVTFAIRQAYSLD